MTQPKATLHAHDYVEQLRRLSGAHFIAANSYGLVTFSLQVAAVALATLPALKNAVPNWSPYLIALFALAATVLRAAAEKHKSAADEMLRRVEAADGTGARLNAREIADWLAAASPVVRWLAGRARGNGSYFASREPPSPRRTVLNTYESAWWSKHLAATQASISWAGIFVILASAGFVLRIAASSAPVISLSAGTVEAANAVILFLLTQAPLRKALGLRAFQSASARVIERAERMLAQPDISEVDAADLRTQYQFARRGAPGISALTWRFRQRRLNKLWAGVAPG